MQLDEHQCYAHRDLPNGLHLCVLPLTYGRARLVVEENTAHLTYYDGW